MRSNARISPRPKPLGICSFSSTSSAVELCGALVRSCGAVTGGHGAAIDLGDNDWSGAILLRRRPEYQLGWPEVVIILLQIKQRCRNGTRAQKQTNHRGIIIMTGNLAEIVIVPHERFAAQPLGGNRAGEGIKMFNRKIVNALRLRLPQSARDLILRDAHKP